MRSDMNKLLCERPRGGWRLKTKRVHGRRFDWDSAPKRGRMPGKLRRTKWLNENLQPLWRFLLSRVGRPWDRVYAEIRADLKIRRAIDLHILQHLEQLVETDVMIIDGMPHVMGRAGWMAIGSRYKWDGLYVCPKSGLLRRLQPARL